MKHGELHNSVRMTWGKAIVEWSKDRHEALRFLIDLNHRYALDGRDPASLGGILWCLGQFDRPFHPEQPIFGKVRTRPIEEHERRTNLAMYEKKVDRPITSSQPRIAIIGAGLGGLMCGRILSDHGLEVDLFDKANRPGGRSCSRQSSLGQFDHERNTSRSGIPISKGILNLGLQTNTSVPGKAASLLLISLVISKMYRHWNVMWEFHRWSHRTTLGRRSDDSI